MCFRRMRRLFFTGTGKSFAGGKVRSGCRSTVSGNFPMRSIRRWRLPALKKNRLTVHVGRASMCRHIFRWKDMMFPSMLTCSIRGTAEKNWFRGRFPCGSIRPRVMWNILKCLRRCGEKKYEFLFREWRAVWRSGWTEAMLGTARTASRLPNLNSRPI